MGRPALDLQITSLRISETTRRRIAALVGSRHMAAFIRDAVEGELVRREAPPPQAEDRAEGADA